MQIRAGHEQDCALQNKYQNALAAPFKNEPYPDQSCLMMRKRKQKKERNKFLQSLGRPTFELVAIVAKDGITPFPELRRQEKSLWSQERMGFRIQHIFVETDQIRRREDQPEVL